MVHTKGTSSEQLAGIRADGETSISNRILQPTGVTKGATGRQGTHSCSGWNHAGRLIAIRNGVRSRACDNWLGLSKLLIWLVVTASDRNFHVRTGCPVKRY